MPSRTDPQSQADERVTELEATLANVREDSEIAYVLLGLSGALAEVRSVEETLDLAVRMTAELYGADRCFAARWDGVEERFELQATWGYTSDEIESVATATGPEAYPLLQRALADGAPLMMADATPVETGAAIAIPLMRWGERFGGLRVAWDRPRAFGHRDEALARGIARQVGIALNNARRFHLMRVLRNFGMRLGSVLSLARVHRIVLEGLVELLNADGAWAYVLDPSKRELISAGGASSAIALPERLARIDVSTGEWTQLFLGDLPVVVDLSSHFGGSQDLIGVAVPLHEEGSPDGALLAVMNRDRAPSREELEACQVLGVQSAQAMHNARRFDRERSVARSLQRGLLATEMPVVAGYRFEALYEPADDEADIGGDLYDVFSLPDGRFGLVIGDVSGKGAEAAAQTAMVKFTLRAFATQDPEPASVLDRLNESLLRDLPEDRFVTVFYGVFDPESGSVSATIAGHPPVLLYRRRSGAIESIEGLGTIVGALPGERFESCTIELDRGDVLLAYTDGLTEARSDDDMYGVERLSRVLAEQAGSGPGDGLARRVFDSARAFGRISDDVVVFSLYRKHH